MLDPVSTTFSALALVLSIVTAWLTLFRKGTLKATQPTVIYLGADRPRMGSSHWPPKVYLKTLLFATSKRGRIIEGMHVSLSRNETKQNFNVWVHGDEKLVRGSGLFVGESGVSMNHHFLTPHDDNTFIFREGIYRLELFAKLLGDRTPIKLFSTVLEINAQHAKDLSESGTGLYFDWGQDSSQYLTHTDKVPLSHTPSESFER